jgi:hypothetical protein
MGFFSFSATFTDLGGDFSGKAKAKRDGDSITLEIGKETYSLPKDLKPGSYSFESRSVTKTSLGKSLFKGFVAMSAAGNRRANPLAGMDTSSTSKETTVNLQFKDNNIFTGVLKGGDFQKFHQELGVVDFSNYQKAYKKRIIELEKFINDLKKNFSNMNGDDQKEATKSMKAAKDRISFLEKEYSQIEKKAK